MDLNEINKDATFNQLRQHHAQLVDELREKYLPKYINTFDQVEGKTIASTDYDYVDMSVILLFTDGTYLKIAYEDNYGSTYLAPSALNLDDLIEYKIMEPKDVAAYQRAKDELREAEVQRAEEQALRNAIAKVGKDRAKEILGVDPC